jgi:phage I-like protein
LSVSYKPIALAVRAAADININPKEAHMSEQLKEELDKVRESLRTFRDREVELTRELGEKPLENIAAGHRQEDEMATLYDRMSSAELHDLYTNNRDEWHRVMDAKYNHGLRKLMGRR